MPFRAERVIMGAKITVCVGSVTRKNGKIKIFEKNKGVSYHDKDQNKICTEPDRPHACR